MGRADHACLNIGKQDRHAIGGHNTQKHIGLVGHHSVAMWWVILRNGIVDLHNIGRMKLMDAGKHRTRQNRLHAE